MKNKHWYRFYKTHGFKLIFLSFVFLALIAFSIIYFTKMKIDKFHVVLTPFSGAWLATIIYFWNKIDKPRATLEISQENYNDSSKDDIFNFVKSSNDNSIYILSEKGIGYFEEDMIWDINDYALYGLKNNSKNSNLIIKIKSKKIDDKYKELLNKTITLRPGEIKFFFHKHILNYTLHYFNTEQYCRKENYEL